MARVGRFLLLTVAIGILVLGALAAWARPPGGRFCECAPIDAPVICDNGKVFSNTCVADCFGGKNCVPYGDGGGIP